MANPEGGQGRVITFYSFKGGTGRTMALANVAMALAQSNGGKKVLAIDWDLEAPGLHRYLRPYLSVPSTDDTDEALLRLPGLIEFLTEARQRVESAAAAPDIALEREDLSSIFQAIDLDRYLIPTDLRQFALMKAGEFDASYQSRISTFDWADLFRRTPAFFGALADYLAQRFDYVLIDSRTGYTDISGICTSLMPDTLAVVFTPNRQNVDGALDITRQAVSYRKNSDDLRPLTVYPLASRVELSELKLNDVWRFGDSAESVRGFQPSFEQVFIELYKLEGCDLTAYFDEAQVAYVPYYAFGEKVAVRSEESATIRLGRSYIAFRDILAARQDSWELNLAEAAREETLVDPGQAIPWDREWFSQHKNKALQGLEKAHRRGYFEVRFSLTRVKTAASRRQLLDAAQAAAVHTTGWPIGIVLQRDGARPRPGHDGIVTEVFGKNTSYDYWALRTNGDFFLLRSLWEDDEGQPGTLAFDQRIRQVAEALLYCGRLFDRLGVTPRAEVRVIIAHSGLEGRKMVSWTQGMAAPPRDKIAETDGPPHEGEFVLGRLEGAYLVRLVKEFCDPLFELFDFQSFDEPFYQKLVGSFEAGKIE